MADERSTSPVFGDARGSVGSAARNESIAFRGDAQPSVAGSAMSDEAEARR